MLRLEYIESAGCYRIYSVADPSKTIGYAGDYDRALEIVRAANQ
jgi:hypothetical protein